MDAYIVCDISMRNNAKIIKFDAVIFHHETIVNFDKQNIKRKTVFLSFLLDLCQILLDLYRSYICVYHSLLIYIVTATITCRTFGNTLATHIDNLKY